MKQGTVFYKMTGSGNDFVMFDGRHVQAAELTTGTIVAICDRRLGIGADGVALLEPSDAAGIHFTFRFWNSDGSPGPMCGNGALCATTLAGALEFTPAGEEVRFATEAGVHRGRVVEGQSEADIVERFQAYIIPSLQKNHGKDSIEKVSTIRLLHPIRMLKNYMPLVNMKDGYLRKEWGLDSIYIGGDLDRGPKHRGGGR